MKVADANNQTGISRKVSSYHTIMTCRGGCDKFRDKSATNSFVSL